MKKQYKPGPGWKQLNPAVYEKGRVRSHVGAELIRVNGRHVGMIPHRPGLSEFIKIAGGNKKRGLMAFANSFSFSG